MTWKKCAGSGMLAGMLITGCYYYLDKRIAIIVYDVLFGDPRFSFVSADIPDTLTPAVCAIVGIAGMTYYHYARKRIFNKRAQFFLFIVYAIPIIFFLESILKIVIGRIDTRFWLERPDREEFQWFHGTGHYGGFPSGHMAVFSVLMIILWNYYPRYRLAYGGFILVLALSLIVTDYHFISDIIGGAWLGAFVYFITPKINPRLQENSMSRYQP